MAQIAPKVFSKDLQEQLFPNNVFYTRGVKDTAANNATAVDIPYSGTVSGGVGAGNPSLPLSLETRTDDITTYSLTQIYHKPVAVTREEEITLSYSKQMSLIKMMAGSITTEIADRTANAWAPASIAAADVILTTGSARATSLVGATGNRKAIAKADLLKVLKAFQKQNLINMNGIVGVVTPDMYSDLLNIAEFTDYEKLGVESKLATGVVGKILGMEIMVRYNAALGSIGLHYTANGQTKKANGTVATTDSPSALFFHPDYVRYCEAYPETIINRAPAGYLGATIIEAVVRYGATANRSDGVGTVVLTLGT